MYFHVLFSSLNPTQGQNTEQAIKKNVIVLIKVIWDKLQEG